MGVPQKNIRVGILEDHLGFMQSVAGVINDLPGMKATLMATNIPVLLHKLQSKAIDILLLDLSLAPPEQGMLKVDGDAVMPVLAEKYPDIKVIVYTQHKDAALIAHLMDKGARAYLCKSCDIAELVTALRKVGETGWYFTDEVSQAVTRHMKKRGQDMNGNGLLANYTENELACWRHMVLGHTIKESSDAMLKSESAVKGYRKALKKKAKCKTSTDLICLGLRLGLKKEEVT